MKFIFNVEYSWNCGKWNVVVCLIEFYDLTHFDLMTRIENILSRSWRIFVSKSHFIRIPLSPRNPLLFHTCIDFFIFGVILSFPRFSPLYRFSACCIFSFLHCYSACFFALYSHQFFVNHYSDFFFLFFAHYLHNITIGDHFLPTSFIEFFAHAAYLQFALTLLISRLRLSISFQISPWWPFYSSPHYYCHSPKLHFFLLTRIIRFLFERKGAEVKVSHCGGSNVRKVKFKEGVNAGQLRKCFRKVLNHWSSERGKVDWDFHF